VGTSAPATRQPVRGSLWARFLVGFLVIWGVLAGITEIDASGRIGLLVLAATMLAAVLVEVLLFGTPRDRVLATLGFRRPRGRPMLAAAVVSVIVLGVYPLLTAVTGETVVLRDDWAWLLIGLFALHGLAEELAWRGYTFARLRAGRTFARAVWLTMPLLAATHVPVIADNGIAVGVGAIIVAAVTTLPFAYLYETSGHTVWAPALLHTAIDSFKLVEIPDEATTAFSMLLVIVSLGVPMLVFALPRRWLEGEAGRPLAPA
jgi:hypothetical protein